MLILIEKDTATRVPKECTPEQAEAFAADFPVHVVGDDGVTTTFAEWKAVQDPQTGAQVVAEDQAAVTDEVAATDQTGGL